MSTQINPEHELYIKLRLPTLPRRLDRLPTKEANLMFTKFITHYQLARAGGQNKILQDARTNLIKSSGAGNVSSGVFSWWEDFQYNGICMEINFDSSKWTGRK